jgi:hypothetical protein
MSSFEVKDVVSNPEVEIPPTTGISSTPDWTQHEFVVPTRGILETRDMTSWKSSDSFKEIFEFIKRCTESVVGMKRSDIPELEDGTTSSGIVSKFVEFMKHMASKVDDFPPLKQPMRFGNKAFKQWHACLLKETDTFLHDLLPPALQGAVKELAPYITNAFGNEVRIDYGTGHETSIMVFFLCLFKLRLVTEGDCAQVVLRGFAQYIQTMRRLQISYLLEPAGSHGAWGLDDYHCLTFLFGSAQLSAQKLAESNYISPSGVHNNDILRASSADYLYLEGIQFIKVLKTGAPFAETSPILNDISGVSDWNKICVGLLKMYQAEVLHKFPVVQHFLFGSILLRPLTTGVDLRGLSLSAVAPSAAV